MSAEKQVSSTTPSIKPASNSEATVIPLPPKSTKSVPPPPKSTKSVLPPPKSTKSVPPLPKSTKSVPPPPKSTTSVPNATSVPKPPPSEQPLHMTTSNQIPSDEPSPSMQQSQSLPDHLLDATISIKEEHSTESSSCSPKTEVTGQTVLVSDSPAKADTNEWLKLPTITLYMHDQLILESAVEWLNSNIIHAAQVLLKSQFPSIYGLTVPQLGDRKQNLMFIPIPPATPFFQILSIDKSHWVAISNTDVGNHSHCCDAVSIYMTDAVSIYDSGSPSRITRQTRQWICSIMKPATSQLRFDLVNIMLQPNGSDCGILYCLCYKVSPWLTRLSAIGNVKP